MTTMANSTIQKSIKIPADIVAFIELQDGVTFTEKFVNLCHEFMYGVDNRKEIIAEYDRMIQERRIRLGELNQKVNGASMLVNRLQVFCSTAEAAGLLEEPENTTSKSIEEREPIPFA